MQPLRRRLAVNWLVKQSTNCNLALPGVLYLGWGPRGCWVQYPIALTEFRLLEGDALTLWMQKQLKPLSKVFVNTSPEIFGWLSLTASLGAGALLYGSAENHWLALVTVPLLAMRLLFDSMEGLLSSESKETTTYGTLLSRLCNRLADVSVFLGLSFWPDVRIHLALLALVSMLIVSYVGELGRSVGADTSGGMLCKTHRTVLLIVFCMIYAAKPGVMLLGFSPFEVMFVLFIPLASLTMLQRLEVILTHLSNSSRK